MSDSSEKHQQIQARIEQLGTQFLQRTRQEIAAMQEHLARLSQGNLDALSQLKFVVHRIHGTGATLGFSSISECAGLLERMINVQPEGVMPDQPMLQRLTESLARLAAEVDEISGQRR